MNTEKLQAALMASNAALSMAIEELKTKEECAVEKKVIQPREATAEEIDKIMEIL